MVHLQLKNMYFRAVDNMLLAKYHKVKYLECYSFIL